MAEALIAAAENGKEVTALFELRARFDESNNIEWSQRFEAAGCHVIYGFRNFKVHSKICTITRQTEDGLQHITQLGTGNYNEKTAKLYTDFSFITTDARIGADAADFFRNMALENTSDNYDILWVAPLMIKQNILRGIDEQIALAKAGKPSGLFFKTNSITDKEVIDKLVEASQAGVETHLFVRGISCILPGVPGYTDHVREVSIVGQLLEHSRIYGFGPRESCAIYLSSADLMTRNMDLMAIWGVIALFRRVMEPKFVGDQTGLSPILSLVSIYVGMKLAGVLGMVFGPVVLLVVLNLAGMGMFRGARLDLEAAARDIAAILSERPL